ncbi:MAG: hypothetical protein OQJ97_06195 [Rhodospirillales bacterium]|nr:hypothetical protein [Rhodospirillales bacterium]
MVNLVEYNELKNLLTEVAELEEKLSPNELEMYHSLKNKYFEAQAVDPFDMTALDVMTRNVKIREGYGIDARKDTGRVITLPRSDEVE